MSADRYTTDRDLGDEDDFEALFDRRMPVSELQQCLRSLNRGIRGHADSLGHWDFRCSERPIKAQLP